MAVNAKKKSVPFTARQLAEISQKTNANCTDFDTTVHKFGRAFCKVCRQRGEIRNRRVTVLFLFCTQQPNNTDQIFLLKAFNQPTLERKIYHHPRVNAEDHREQCVVCKLCDIEMQKSSNTVAAYLLDDRRARASSRYKAGSLLYVTTNTRHFQRDIRHFC